jgi:hypothetical protein
MSSMLRMKSLAGMIASGELQAGFTGPAGIGRTGPPTGAWEQGGQKPAEVYPELIPDAAQAEANWFRRTGIYPIHGLITVKTDILKKDPWVAKSLYDAFVEAKQPYIAHDSEAHGARRGFRRSRENLINRWRKFLEKPSSFGGRSSEGPAWILEGRPTGLPVLERSTTKPPTNGTST